MAELKKPIVWPEIAAPKEDGSNLYAEIQKYRHERWGQLAQAYEDAPDDFYTAWRWLKAHPIFYYFGGHWMHEGDLADTQGVHEGLEFEVVKVNAGTRRIEEDLPNDLVQLWVEVFPTSLRKGAKNTMRLHDVECDTGGHTYEEAVINVAKEIYDRHGHDRVVLEEVWKSA